jgi:hypothetical protein
MLADLIVYGSDPLADLKQSENIDLVMLNGRLYDARTLDELEPDAKPLPPKPFIDEVTPDFFIGQGCGLAGDRH